jgi:hypothetical protein
MTGRIGARHRLPSQFTRPRNIPSINTKLLAWVSNPVATIRAPFADRWTVFPWRFAPH